MTYEQAKKLLEEKGQEHLLKYYDELDEAGKATLLNAIEELNWEFEDALANPVDLSGAANEHKREENALYGSLQGLTSLTTETVTDGNDGVAALRMVRVSFSAMGRVA